MITFFTIKFFKSLDAPRSIVQKLKIKKSKLNILQNLYSLPQKYPRVSLRMSHQTDRKSTHHEPLLIRHANVSLRQKIHQCKCSLNFT